MKEFVKAIDLFLLMFLNVTSKSEISLSCLDAPTAYVDESFSEELHSN
jgi:hypothetical protein